MEPPSLERQGPVAIEAVNLNRYRVFIFRNLEAHPQEPWASRRITAPLTTMIKFFWALPHPFSAPADTLQPRERSRARTTSLSHSWIPDPQEGTSAHPDGCLRLACEARSFDHAARQLAAPNPARPWPPCSWTGLTEHSAQTCLCLFLP
ncbi:uncharacterized protein LOC144613796 [Panthera onca]